MEDALAQSGTMSDKEKMKVLILVLMEDALAQVFLGVIGGLSESLNPCFNGRCTRTAKLG